MDVTFTKTIKVPLGLLLVILLLAAFTLATRSGHAPPEPEPEPGWPTTSHPMSRDWYVPTTTTEPSRYPQRTTPTLGPYLSTTTVPAPAWVSPPTALR